MTEQIFIAVLPVLQSAASFHEAFFVGALAAVSFWASSFMFQFLTPFFPDPLKKISLLLWLATLGQLGMTCWALKPFWVLSVYLMLSPHLLSGRGNQPYLSKKTAPILIWKGLGFWMLMAYLGIFREVLGTAFGFPFFTTAAGTFLLLDLGFLAAGARRPVKRGLA